MTTGVKSNFQLVRLAAKYNEMQKDGRLLSNRSSIEVIRMRIQQLAERIDMNEAPDRLAKLQKLWLDLKEAEATHDPKTILIKFEIDAEFEAAYHDYAAWKQMFEAVDLDRKLVESEVKILKEINATLTAEDAYRLTAKLLAVIMSSINTYTELSQEAKSILLKRIAYEFTSAIGDGINSKVILGFNRSSEEDGDSGSGEMDREGILYSGNQERSEIEGQDDAATLSEGHPE